MIDQVPDPNRKLRILHVLRAPLGGLFRHVVDLTREQVARGHAVGLVVDSQTGGPGAADNLAKLAPQLELGIKRLPMLRRPNAGDATTIFKVDAHAHRIGADVIHGHGSKGGLYARAPGFWRRKDRTIRCYTPHGGSFNHVSTPLVQSLYMTVERMLATRTDVLLFESVFIANVFRQRIGDTQALVHIVQNGISPAEFVPVTPNADAADFLYVGELRSAKGIDTLIDALAILSRGVDRTLRLILVGSGPDQARLEAQAAHRGVAAQVSFPGVIPARKAFAMGRMLVVPSRAESLPYVVLEAAGAKIPMLATDVGGIGEIFGPFRGRLLPCNDPAVLADAMRRMLAMDPLARKQGAEDLSAFVSARFAISVMADAVLAGYADAFARRTRPKGTISRSMVHQ